MIDDPNQPDGPRSNERGVSGETDVPVAAPGAARLAGLLWKGPVIFERPLAAEIEAFERASRVLRHWIYARTETGGQLNLRPSELDAIRHATCWPYAFLLSVRQQISELEKQL